MRHSRVAALVAAVFLSAGVVSSPVSAAKKPVYEIDEARNAVVIEAVEGATGQPVLSGEIDGAAWLGQVPDNWNGDLIVWAHGYRGEGLQLYVDPPPEVAWLVSQGYAWAASSYRRNSYDPGIGVIDTKNLTDYFKDMLGDDLDTTYLAGASMGGHVTAAAIEQFPSFWDGAMPICGVVGDVELFDYFTDYSVGAAAIAGLGTDYPIRSPEFLTETAPEIKQALSTDPAGAWAGGLPQAFGAPSPLTPAGQRFKDFVEIGSGGDRVTYDTAWLYWHGLASATGDFFFELAASDGTVASRSGTVGQNVDTVYADEYGPSYADLDASVLRLSAANRVRKSQGMQPTVLINGTPSVPVLSMHTTGDLFVPIEMEQIYAQEVQANGLGDLLVQRAIRDVGHCSFTGPEIQQGFSDLFAWVEDGVKPAGEDLVNDISSPTLGCDFTVTTNPLSDGSRLRFLLEPCS